MTRRLVVAIVAVAAAVALSLAIPLVLLVAADQRAAFVSDLEIETLSAASLLSSQRPSDWAATAAAVATRTGARVVVVDTARRLVADSDLSGLDRAFDRPEIARALDGFLTSDVRPSATLGADIRYVAAPVVQRLTTVAAVRLSVPEGEVAAAVRTTQYLLAAFVLAVMLAAAIIAWLLARSIAAPLGDLAEVAGRLPDDLNLRADEWRGPPEVRSVAAALNATATRLSDLVSRTQRVAVDASHHLRTPLTGVRLRLEAIEDMTSGTPVAEQAQAATTEVDRLARRIDQVLALARSDSGAAPVEVVDVAVIVAQRVNAFGDLAQSSGRHITVSAETDAPALALRGSVARSVDELLSNALNYARSRVNVRVAVEGTWVQLTVSDDGPGVEPAELERLFDRFARGRDAVEGGSGLGLALVRESAVASGGSAQGRRSELGGLAVEVRWPRA